MAVSQVKTQEQVSQQKQQQQTNKKSHAVT
jgi:hypothetical protein